MRENIFVLGLTLLMVVFLSACSSNKSSNSGDCAILCQALSGKCDKVNLQNCQKDCLKWDEAKKSCLSKANTCAEMEQTCAWKTATITPTAIKDCTAACNNYVKQCISMVPNADDALRKEAFNSCTDECQSWSNDKIGCMAGCTDCPSMTEVCGL